LEDLLTHPGWLVYQELLDELVDIAKGAMRAAKDWEGFVMWRAKLDCLEYDIKQAIQDELGRGREE
jgi:hypothetical protein